MYDTFSRIALTYALGTPLPVFSTESSDFEVTLIKGIPEREGGGGGALPCAAEGAAEVTCDIRPAPD